ncbi:hypothetical protein [Psychrobacter urativorans]|uniref:Uncharacterized protein n=1 Tax=Psychrobacter urativorans TaxID=45610 RepID=A0A0M4SVI5_9GAMM|nr:hypothetical protein [Psychrobacter urativorans]ALF58635.1 hypothetical protein AOC03_00065 [Psychrobacter urativorans]
MEWINKPEHDLDIEDTWQKFVKLQDGKVLSDDFGTSVDFANADFWFEKDRVIIELKEIQTEFLDKNKEKIQDLINKYVKKDNLSLKDIFAGNFPDSFWSDYVRLVRPAISRILRKANKQIKETRKYLEYPEARGIVVLVNDGFTSFSAQTVLGLVCNILVNIYSSIDGFVLLTVNSYVAIENSNIPCQVWIPSYSPGIEYTSLPDFVNELGREWRKFIDTLIGPSDLSEERDSLSGMGSMPYINRLE